MIKDEKVPLAYLIVQNLRKICNHPHVFFRYHKSPDAALGAKEFYHKRLETLNSYKEFGNQPFVKGCLESFELSPKLRVLFNLLE